jgi:hypothetical protein
MTRAGPIWSALPAETAGQAFACQRAFDDYSAPHSRHGEVAEWLKALAWKACIRETVSRVRIPPSPPPSLLSFREKFLRNELDISAGYSICALASEEESAISVFHSDSHQGNFALRFFSGRRAMSMNWFGT